MQTLGVRNSFALIRIAIIECGFFMHSSWLYLRVTLPPPLATQFECLLFVFPAAPDVAAAPVGSVADRPDGMIRGMLQKAYARRGATATDVGSSRDGWR